MTGRILEFLLGHSDIRIERIVTQRSKDREDPMIERNTKKMVHIQYQESVHCLAFALFLLAHSTGGLANVFEGGMRVHATALPYRPPNPQDYAHVVDGQCHYEMLLGDTEIEGCTDFTRGAPWSKRREITGRVDGKRFSIVADYLEGRKMLVIDREPQGDVVESNSYVEVISTIDRWICRGEPQQLLSGIYPHSRFAQVTYQLSSTLWHSSWNRVAVELADLPQLLEFDAGFAEAVPCFDRYAN